MPTFGNEMRYSQLLKFITPHRTTLLAVVCLLLCRTGVTLAHPMMAGMLTRVLLEGQDSGGPAVLTILVSWLVLMIIQALLNISSSYLIGSTGAGMSSQLRTRVYEHMQILPLSYYQARKQGNVLSLLSNDAASISGFVTDTLVQLLPLVLTFVSALLIMAWLDLTIAMLAAFLMPLYFIVLKIMGRKIRPISTAWVRSRSSMVAFVNENLGLMPAIKSFAREPIESGRFGEHNTELFALTRRRVWISSLLYPTIGLLAGASSLLLLWVGIGHIASGQLQPSELVSLLMYVALLTGPISSLARVYGQVMQTRGAAERLLEFFNEQPEPTGIPGKPIEIAEGHIEFRDITFGYRDGPKSLKDSVSISTPVEPLR